VRHRLFIVHTVAHELLACRSWRLQLLATMTALYSIPGAWSPSMLLPPCRELAIALCRYFVSNDGTSNWLMGVQLIVTYLLIAIVYFFRTG